MVLTTGKNVDDDDVSGIEILELKRVLLLVLLVTVEVDWRTISEVAEFVWVVVAEVVGDDVIDVTGDEMVDLLIVFDGVVSGFEKFNLVDMV